RSGPPSENCPGESGQGPDRVSANRLPLRPARKKDEHRDLNRRGLPSNTATGGGPFESLGLPPNLPGGGTSTTIYDEHDRPTEVEVRDAKGELVMHATRTYDSQGRVTAEKQFHDNFAPMFAPETQEKILQESGLSSEQLATLLQAELPKLMGGHTE